MSTNNYQNRNINSPVVIKFILLFSILSIFYPSQGQTPEKLTVHFFGSSTCGECNEIKWELLQPLAEKYPEKLYLKLHDIDTEEGMKLAYAFENKFNIKDAMPQEIFLADTFLLGYESIMADAESVIEHYLNNPEKWKESNAEKDTLSLTKTIRKRLERFTFLGVFLAGLADGINPCAIATMIFLISFLATQKRKRLEVLIIGLFFTAAVFITYLLLGLGAFRLLTALDQYHWVSEVIRWSAVVLAGVLAIISFADAFSYKKTGKADKIKLQLPKAVKMKIHKVISGNLKGSQLITGAIITGFLVTLLEAVCTGQVYLPTILLMTKSSGFHLKGWLYLIFYNFLFILPLLIVMILAFYGLKWNELAKITQKHLAVLKILLGIVFGGLAVFLAIAG